MTNNESNQNSSEQLAKIAPIVRGLLAERTGEQDIPYNPVILKSLTSKEAVNFAGTENIAEAQHYPAPLTSSPRPPLFLDATDEHADPEDLRKQLSGAISDYSARHKSKPEILCVRDLGILYVDQRDSNSDLPLRNKVALVTGAAEPSDTAFAVGFWKRAVTWQLPTFRAKSLIVSRLILSKWPAAA